MLRLYRRNKITTEEVERQLDDIEKDAATLRQELDTMRSQAELAQALETQLAEAATMLAHLQSGIDEIERQDDWDTKRRIVEMLVSGIAVETLQDGEARSAKVTLRYAFGQPSKIDFETLHPSAPRYPARRGA